MSGTTDPERATARASWQLGGLSDREEYLHGAAREPFLTNPVTTSDPRDAVTRLVKKGLGTASRDR